MKQPTMRETINLIKAMNRGWYKLRQGESQLQRAIGVYLGYFDENGNPKSRRMRYQSGQIPKKA